MRVYDLTELVGRRADARLTVTVKTFSASPRVIKTVFAALPVAIIAGLLASIVMGQYALLVSGAVLALSALLFATDTSDARSMTRYKALLDGRRAAARVGRFYVGGTPFDPNECRPIRMTPMCLTRAQVEAGRPGARSWRAVS